MHEISFIGEFVERIIYDHQCLYYFFQIFLKKIFLSSDPTGRHKLSKTSPESWGNGLHFKHLNISLKTQRATLMLGSVTSVRAFSTQKIQNSVRTFNLILQCSYLFFLKECCLFMEATSIVPKNYNMGNTNLSLI